MQQDPYASIKLQYRMQRLFIYFIMAIIGITFINLVWKFQSTGTMGNFVRVFMVCIGVFMLYQIYAKTILPTKKILQHYEMSPQPISSVHVDVPTEVDNILNKFDEHGNRIK